MKHVGAFEAKTHFSQLLAEVAEGNKIVITKHGEEVAMLMPIQAKQMNQTAQAIATIKQLRSKATLGSDLRSQDLKREGRR